MSNDGSSPWTSVTGINALRVPGHTQPDREPECLLYALWMVLQFISTAYPNSSVRNAVDPLNPDQMKESITIRRTGWSPDQADLDALSEQTHPVSWILKYWKGAPPSNSLFEVIQDGLDDYLPTIVVVDAMRLQDLDRRGPLHAVVATGLDDRRVVINDPWGTIADVYPRDTIADAWDTTLNRVITIDLSEQTTLQETLNEDPEDNE